MGNSAETQYKKEVERERKLPPRTCDDTKMIIPVKYTIPTQSIYGDGKWYCMHKEYEYRDRHLVGPYEKRVNLCRNCYFKYLEDSYIQESLESLELRLASANQRILDLMIEKYKSGA